MNVLRILSTLVLTTAQGLIAARRPRVALITRNVALRWLLLPATIAMGVTALGPPDFAPMFARPASNSNAPLMGDAVVVDATMPSALPCSNNEMSFMNGCPDAATVPPNSGGHTWMVFLLNETDGPLSGTLSCEFAGQVSSCALSESNYSMPANDSFGFTVTYDVGVGPGTVTVTASHWQQPISATLNVNAATPTYTVVVTPDGGSATRAAFSAVSESFTVQRTGNTGTIYNLSVVCAPPAATDCSAPASVNLTSATSAVVNVSYKTGSSGQTGTIRLLAWYPASPAINDDGSIAITVGAGGPGSTVVSVADANPGTTPERDLCLTVAIVDNAAFECGDLRVVHALTSARTMSTARTPALLYNSRFAQAAPILGAHVTLAAGAPTPSKVTADLLVRNPSGTWISRASGEWQGSDFVEARPTRIALSYDAIGDSADVYDYRFDVTVWNGGTPSPAVRDSAKFVLVNRAASYFGAGWWLGGLERLVIRGDGSIVWIGGDGSARHYVAAGAGKWVAALVERPDTVVQDGSSYLRVLPRGLVVKFNATGRHEATINRLGHTTRFTYDGSGRLQQIELPIASTTGATRYCSTCLPSGSPPTPPVPAPTYTFAYEGTQVRVTAPPSPTSGGDQVRETIIALSGGTATSIRDPDLKTVSFDYGTGAMTRRMNSRTDRRGTRTRFGYAAGHVFNYASVDSALNLAWIETRFDTVALGRGLAEPGITARAAAVADVMTFIDGPRPDTSAVDHTRVWTDRFGAPTRIRNALGHETTLTHGDARFPALVTELRGPTGFTTWATYDARGNVATSTAVRPYADARDARTIYAWNQKFDLVESLALPEGEISRLGYDANNGNRLWQEDGRGTPSRVNFVYYSAWGSPGGPGVLRAIVRPGGARDSITHDSLTNLSGLKSPSGGWTHYESDRVGRLRVTRQQIDATHWQHDSTTAYDLTDRATRSVTFGDSLNGRGAQRIVVRNEYDDDGNLKSLKRVSLPDTAHIDTIKTQWHYDRVGRQVAEIAPDLRKDSTVFDLAGNAIQIVTRRDSVIRMQYDALNRLTQRVVPAAPYASRDQGISTLNLQPETPPDYPRYPLDPETGTLTIPAEVQTFAYDTAGNMTVADNNDARVRRSYYPNGQLKTDTLMIRTYAGTDFTKHRYGILHRYDRNGRRTITKHPWQLAPRLSSVQDSVRYEYDPVVGYLNTVWDLIGYKHEFLVNERGERFKMTLTSTMVDSSGYDPAGRLTSHRIFDRATMAEFPHPDVVLRNDTLTYDLRDKVLKSAGRQGFADTTTTKYSGLGHAIEFDFAAPALTNYGLTARVVTKERMRLDALGNSYVLYDSTNAHGQSQSITTRRRDLTYQSGTGRLLTAEDDDRRDAYEYDVAGNTGFFWQSAWDLDPGVMLENRASFYAMDGRLRAADYRKTWVGLNKFSPETWWWDSFFEEFRYDALGRRVLVRQRKRCKNLQYGPLDECMLSLIRRTVWDGDEELYEIQMPGGDEVNADTLENDTLFIHRRPAEAPSYPDYYDSNPRFGRVAYLHATGIDVPISLVRMNYEDHPYGKSYQAWPLPFVVVPHWNWRGQAEYGTYGDGSYKRCYPSDSTRCVQVQWSTKAFAFQDPAKDSLASWIGTLIDEKHDATGTLYRRNRHIDPATGRFTQEDPIGLAGGLNLYGFGSGDPVNFGDPFGLCPWCIAYAIFEIGSTLYDLGDLAVTGINYLGGRASGRDVAVTAGGAAFGLVGFGGGYGRGARELLGALDELSSAARAIDRGGLTKAGRALTKHARGQRAGSQLFPELGGSVDDVNRIAGDIVDDILTNPKSAAVVIKRGRFKGGVDIYDPSGRGVRYDAEGNFVTFLERQGQ
jgi:RHS repeat-associated protein